MPAKSAAQHRLMEAAAHTPGGYGGVPQSVGKEFTRDDAAPEFATELEAAHAIAEHRAKSPLLYQNAWLYAIRITGTGASYRVGIKEYVWRDPGIFLSPDFVDRCAGLPVILVHPETSVLNAEEFDKRSVGTIILPYRDGDEVWGIARIFDGDVVQAMESGELSTSPAVRFTAPGSLASAQIDDDALTIEGTPSLVDHIAIVPAGVWDKGGPPSGIRNDAQKEPEGERKYGDVKFADPKNDKYPIDDPEHIRAAWDYIHKHEDADKYDAKDLAAIKRRIVAAWKDKIDPSGPPEAASKKDIQMAEPDKGETTDEPRDDAAKSLMSKLDAITSKLDSLGSRMDAVETKSRKDAESEEERAENTRKEDEKRDDAAPEATIVKSDAAKKGARKDETEEEKRALDKANEARDDETEEEKESLKKAREAKERDDANARENTELRRKIAAMEAKLDRLDRAPSYEDAEALAKAQARADAALQMLGERPERPFSGESSVSFRKRVLTKLAKHSPKLKNVSVSKLDGVILDQIEDVVYADAQSAALHPGKEARGRLNAIVINDGVRNITRYTGDPHVWRDQFSAKPLHAYVDRPRGGYDVAA